MPARLNRRGITLSRALICFGGRGLPGPLRSAAGVWTEFKSPPTAILHVGSTSNLELEERLVIVRTMDIIQAHILPPCLTAMCDILPSVSDHWDTRAKKNCLFINVRTPALPPTAGDPNTQPTHNLAILWKSAGLRWVSWRNNTSREIFSGDGGLSSAYWGSIAP